MNSHQKEVLKAWIAAGLWLTLIAIESTSYLSSANTSHVLYPLFHFLFGFDPMRFAVWHHYIRKTGHFVGYFTLSLLLFRAWKATLPSAYKWEMRWAAIAFLMSAFVGSMDEFHQTFLPSRTGLVSDAILDSTAELIAQVVIFVVIWLWGLRSRQEEAVPVARSF
ncbi:MAG: VanZ family protein [Acidobacteriaceae bacterium]|nr:VanZ family protein [Acidobacteriaceae bacterium]